MSLDRLLVEPLTIRRRAAAPPDAEGNPVATTVDTATTGRVEQVAADDRAGGDRRDVRWRVFLRPAEQIDGGDQVVTQDGQVLEVEGAPAVHRTPRGVHHIEVTARAIG